MAGKPGMQGRKPRQIPERFAAGWLAGIDRRYKPAIHATSVYLELVESLGGFDTLSPQRRMLAEHATWLHIRLQAAEVEFLTGNGLDAGEYTSLVNSLAGVLAKLGLNRISRDAPSLQSYLASKARRSA